LAPAVHPSRRAYARTEFVPVPGTGGGDGYGVFTFNEDDLDDDNFYHEDDSVVEAYDRERMRRQHALVSSRLREEALGIPRDVNLSTEDDLHDFEALNSDESSDELEDSDDKDDPSPLDANFARLTIGDMRQQPLTTGALVTEEEIDEYIANLVDIDDDDALLGAAQNRDEIRSWQATGWEEGKWTDQDRSNLVLITALLS
jgi:hypothetical protein